MTRHCKSRHGEKAYGPCGYCGGRFARSDAYKRHLKVEEERRGGGVMVGGLNRIGVDRVGQQRFQYQVNSVNPSSSS